MESRFYRLRVRQIVGGVLRKRFPGLNKEASKKAAEEIAINVHACMYGANVDGVASPIWRNSDEGLPTKDASELLKELT